MEKLDNTKYKKGENVMKFELTANTNLEEGFRVKVQADTPEELQVVNDLTKQLIDKISVIEIKINQSDEY